MNDGLRQFAKDIGLYDRFRDAYPEASDEQADDAVLEMAAFIRHELLCGGTDSARQLECSYRVLQILTGEETIG